MMSIPPRSQIDINVSGAGYTYRFSRGLLAHTLKSRGFELDVGYKIARRVYQHLIQENINLIEETKLRSYIREAALEITGKAIDDRYVLVERWHDSTIPLILMISGARGMGKSDLGIMLASRFSFPKIVSTATVAQIMRKMITPDLAPELHCKSYEAYKKLRPIYSIMHDKVLVGYEEHAKFPAEAVEAVVKRAVNESQNLIIRGEHLLPRFLSDELLSHPSIIYITIDIPDEDVHRKRYLHQYPENQMEERAKHFNSIRKIHNYLVEQAISREHIVVDGTSFSKAIETIEDIVYAKLRRMFPSSGKIKYDFHSYDNAVINS